MFDLRNKNGDGGSDIIGKQGMYTRIIIRFNMYEIKNGMCWSRVAKRTRVPSKERGIGKV